MTPDVDIMELSTILKNVYIIKTTCQSVKSTAGKSESRLTWVVHYVCGDPLRRDVGWNGYLLGSKGNLDHDGQ